MAPAVAAVREEGLWGEEMENNVDFELGTTSSSGAGSQAAAESDADHGWQQVTNPKRARRQQRKKANGDAAQEESSGIIVGGIYTEDPSSGFEAVEKEAAARRERRKSRQAAWESRNGNHSQDQDQDQEHERSEEDEDHAQVRKKKRVKKPKVSFKEAASHIDSGDLASYLRGLSESLAASPGMQLVRCTDYFEKAVSAVNSGQFFWDAASKDSFRKSVEVPLCDLPADVRTVTSDWLSRLPVHELSEYVVWALSELLEIPSQPKGGRKTAPQKRPAKTKASVSVVLALLLRRRPDALLLRAEQLRSSAFQGALKLHTLAWAYGQVAKGDVASGMAIWVQNLLPLAAGNSSTPASRDVALQFIESIEYDNKTRSILLGAASKRGERLVPPSALINLLYMAYPSQQSRTKATDRFVQLYPRVKEIALAGQSGSKALKPVAQQLAQPALVAAGEDAPGLSSEGCDLFRWCLSQSTECYKQWERLHLEKVKSSGRVLGHLLNDWSRTAALLAPLVALRSTIGALRVQNASALENAVDEKTRAELKSADAQCRVIQRKLLSTRSCVVAAATIACGGAMLYGVYLLSAPSVTQWNWDIGVGKLIFGATSQS